MVKVIVFQCLVLGLMKQATSVAQAVNRSINNAEKPKIAWCVNWNHYLSICSGNSNICCSVTQSCLNICDPVDGSTPGLPVCHQLPEFTQTLVHWVSDAIQPSHPVPLLLPPSMFPRIRVFTNESVLCIRWPKYWSFSFRNSPSNEYLRLIPTCEC